MNGIEARAKSRPSVSGTPNTAKPISIANSRPQNLPDAVADNDGQTVITVTSCNCVGATPGIACFMERVWSGRILSKGYANRALNTRCRKLPKLQPIG